MLNDGAEDAGGVETYLSAFESGMRVRGHEVLRVALRGSSTHASQEDNTGAVQTKGSQQCVEETIRFEPDLCYSHNMDDLSVDESITQKWPTFKFMHGYFGTCISGLKSTRTCGIRPCDRTFGFPCLALYAPLRCGRLRLGSWANGFRWSRRQQKLFSSYKAILVASEHMRAEYVRNGCPEEVAHTNPLFAPSVPVRPYPDPNPPVASWIERDSGTHKIIFLGRMTPLKGLTLAIEAISELSGRLTHRVRLVCAGDGPELGRCRQLATRLGVDVQFMGWLEAKAMGDVFRDAALLVLPSVWPEPFGLVGLEAARHGIPAVSFDVGGIREWLHHGVNGYQVPQRDLSPKGLADAMHQALIEGSTWARLSDGARAMARRLSLDAHIDRFETLCAAHGIG